MVFVETSFPRGGAVKPKPAPVQGDKPVKEKKIVRIFFSNLISVSVNSKIYVFYF